ncbi:Rho GTPase activating protein, partial [Elasticomyces elasticus]
MKEQQTREVSEEEQPQQQQQQKQQEQEQQQNLPPSLPAPNPPMRTGLPASPRPGASQFPPLDRTESLASVLNPRIGHTGSLKENSLMSSAPKSPGLPLSPRPEDRPLGSPMPRMPKEVPGALTPVSIPSDSSNLSGLALSPRATSSSNNNPFTSKEPLSINVPMSVTPPIPSIDAAVKIDTPRSPMSDNDGIYRGFVSDNHPDLLLPPNALPLIEVKVSSSRLRPSRNSYMALRPTDEEPVFTLSVVSRSDNKELWRVEKVIAALPQLDQQIRPACSFAGVLPDRSIFSGHSPARIDARRAALTSYFDTLMDTPMSENAALIV